MEQQWPPRLGEAITESRLLQTVRLELSSSALASNGAHAVELLRMLSSGGHLKKIVLAIKLPDLRPEVLSALLQEVAKSPKVHEMEVHCTGADCALVAMGHIASGAVGHVTSWQVALAFAEGAAEAAMALVTVGAAAGVKQLSLIIRGPGGTVPDPACEQLALVLAREKAVAVKVVCRVTEAGRASFKKIGALLQDPDLTDNK